MKRPRTLLGVSIGAAGTAAAFVATGHVPAGVVMVALAIAIASTAVSIIHRKDPRA